MNFTVHIAESAIVNRDMAHKLLDDTLDKLEAAQAAGNLREKMTAGFEEALDKFVLDPEDAVTALSQMEEYGLLRLDPADELEFFGEEEE